MQRTSSQGKKKDYSGRIIVFSDKNGKELTKKVKEYFLSMSLDISEIKLDFRPRLQQLLADILEGANNNNTKKKDLSTPQIFFNSLYIGGYEEFELEKSKEEFKDKLRECLSGDAGPLYHVVYKRHQDLFELYPPELYFPPPFGNSPIVCCLYMKNRIDRDVIFKIKTKCPEVFTVKPPRGSIGPFERTKIEITLLNSGIEISQEDAKFQVLGLVNSNNLNKIQADNLGNNDTINKLFEDAKDNVVKHSINSKFQSINGDLMKATLSHGELLVEPKSIEGSSEKELQMVVAVVKKLNHFISIPPPSINSRVGEEIDEKYFNVMIEGDADGMTSQGDLRASSSSSIPSSVVDEANITDNTQQGQQQQQQQQQQQEQQQKQQDQGSLLSKSLSNLTSPSSTPSLLSISPNYLGQSPFATATSGTLTESTLLKEKLSIIQNLEGQLRQVQQQLKQEKEAREKIMDQQRIQSLADEDDRRKLEIEMSQLKSKLSSECFNARRNLELKEEVEKNLLEKLSKLTLESDKEIQKVKEKISIEYQENLDRQLKSQSDMLEKLKESHAETLNSLQKKYTRVSEELEKANALLQERQENVQKLKQELENTQRKLKEEDDHSKKLDLEFVQLKTVSEKLQKEKDIHLEALRKKGLEKAQLEEDLDLLKKEQLKQIGASDQEKILAMSTIIDRLTKNNKGLESELEALKNSIKELRETFQKDSASVGEEHKKNLMEKESLIQKLQSSLMEDEEKLAKMTTDTKDLQKQLEDVSIQRKKQNDELEALKVELASTLKAAKTTSSTYSSITSSSHSIGNMTNSNISDGKRTTTMESSKANLAKAMNELEILREENKLLREDQAQRWKFISSMLGAVVSILLGVMLLR